MGAAGTRRELVKGLWPDKTLYGALMLFVTGILGVLHAVFIFSIDPQFSDRVPGFLRGWPPTLTLLLSVVAIVAAAVSWRTKNTGWAIGGAVAGFLSMGLLGLASVLSVISLVFLVWARAEGEHHQPETLALPAHLWPDKSLAASMLTLVGGVLTFGWGLAIATDRFEFAGYLEDTVLFGELCMAAGVLCFAAAYMLYHQRGRAFGVLGAVGGVLALGLYAIGPLLSLLALFFIWRASHEREFRSQNKAAPAPSAAPVKR